MAVSIGDLVAFRSSCKLILKIAESDVKSLTQDDLDKIAAEAKAMLRLCNKSIPH